jgi:hypothetical protein
MRPLSFRVNKPTAIRHQAEGSCINSRSTRITRGTLSWPVNFHAVKALIFPEGARRSISDKAKFDSKPGQHGRFRHAHLTLDFSFEKQKVKRMRRAGAVPPLF